jgi:hypothetical protein
MDRNPENQLWVLEDDCGTGDVSVRSLIREAGVLAVSKDGQKVIVSAESHAEGSRWRRQDAGDGQHVSLVTTLGSGAEVALSCLGRVRV